MSWQHVSRTFVLLLGGLAAGAIWLALDKNNQGSAGQLPVIAAPATTAASQAAGQKEDRPADQDAVRKAVAGLVAAFHKGDAKAVAALWTAQGEYIGDDGATFRGRAALEKEYSGFFTKNPGNTLEVEVDSIRFPSRDNAVVEGHFKLHLKGGETSREPVQLPLHPRRRQVADRHRPRVARRWAVAPRPGVAHRHLGGEAGRHGSSPRSTSGRRTSRSSAATSPSRRTGETQTGMQIIGKMPSTGELHMWTFEDSGGIGDSDITRDGKKWVYRRPRLDRRRAGADRDQHHHAHRRRHVHLALGQPRHGRRTTARPAADQGRALKSKK